MNFQQVGIIAALVVLGLSLLIYLRFFVFERILTRMKLRKTRAKLVIMRDATVKKVSKIRFDKMIRLIDVEIEKLS